MARLINHKANRPIQITKKHLDDKEAVCMCGLSKSYPFCDGSHHATDGEDPKKVYVYDAQGHREEVDSGCACGRDCGCSHS